MLTCLAALGSLACDPVEEQISSDSSLRLTFSKDTVSFDTLFSGVQSVTKRLRVTNHNKHALRVQSIRLGLGKASDYALMVNGKRGYTFKGEVIFGGDSLLALVQLFIPPKNQDAPFVVQDNIVFDYNTQSHSVKLHAWGQDVYTIRRAAIDCQSTWTNRRPYLIYDSAWVAQGCKLTIKQGTKVYLGQHASLAILGTLTIKGTAEEKVVIRNFRRDPRHLVAPGQWNSIYFHPGSTGNTINHAKIENGTNGLLLLADARASPSVQIQISHTTIGHLSGVGIAARAAQVYAYNTAVFNCQSQLIAHLEGGDYRYEHCTFANTPNTFGRSDASPVIFSDHGALNSPLPLTLTLINTIAWSVQKEALQITTNQSASRVTVHHNIIRSANKAWANKGNQISEQSNYPQFVSPSTFNYRLKESSPAINTAQTSTITHDVLGRKREAIPDIGAYEFSKD